MSKNFPLSIFFVIFIRRMPWGEKNEMNGKKILNQLIKVFLVINIVLLIVNYFSKSNQYILSGERIHNITRLLERNGIQVKAEILRNFAPKRPVSLMFMGNGVEIRDKVVKQFFGNDLKSVKRSTTQSKKNKNEKILYYILDDEILAFEHDKLIYMNGKNRNLESKPTLEQAKNMCSQLISRIDSTKQELNYKVTEEDYETFWKLTYYPIIEDMPVLDSCMEFEVYNDGVAKAEMHLVSYEMTGDKQDIYPADLVLFGIEDYMLENGYTSIEDISMCYKRAHSEENIWSQEIIPTYKIKVGGLEKPIFVNAYTNEMIKLTA